MKDASEYERLLGGSLLVLNSAVLLFHICVILKVIPYNIVWGGRLQGDAEMYVFESISIFINLIFSLTLLIRVNFISSVLSPRAVRILLWVFFAVYSLNTLGNLFAETSFEKYFAILTGLFAVLTAMLIWKNR